MAGGDLNIAFGNWLVKTEASYFNGIRLNDTLIDTTIISLSQNNHSRVNTLIGIEYSGFSDTIIMMEVMNEHLNDIGLIEKSTGYKENSLQSSIRASRNFLNERLEIIRIMNQKYQSKIPEDYAGTLIGWTGAEIEQLAKDSLFDGLEIAYTNIVPLSKSMKEDISGLQQWAESRARKANTEELVARTKRVRRIK